MMVFGSSSNEPVYRAEQWIKYPDALRPTNPLQRMDNQDGGGYVSCYWPARSSIYSESNDFTALNQTPPGFDLMTVEGYSGGITRKLGVLTAVVRDINGSLVSDASCNLVRNSDNTVVDTGVTDANGQVQFMTNAAADTHRVVSKAGIAETLQGTSANTIVGI